MTNSAISADLFPLAPGYTWVYRYGDLSFTSTARGQAYADGKSYASVETDGPDGMLLYQVSDDEISYCPVQRVISRDPGGQVVILRPKLRLGQSWTTEEGQRIVKIAAWEDITVPAGEFKCLRIESYSAGKTLLETAWYAPGVGLVRKCRSGETQDLALVSFTTPLQSEAAQLRVESEPPGIEIVLGLFPTGRKTPADFSGLAAGKHQVALLPEQGISWQRFLQLSPGETATVNFPLVRFGEPITFSASQGLRSSQINCLLAASDGSLWCGTHGGGASRYRKGIWGHFDQHNSGADDYITALAEDREGRIWLATHGRGLASLAARDREWLWRSYRRETGELTDDFLSCLACSDDSALWIGTESTGLLRFKDGNFTSFDPKNSPLPGAWIRDLALDKEGMIWVATDEGLARGDGQRWETVAGPPHPRRLLVTREGDLWCGTFGAGLFRFRENNWELHATANGDLLHDDVWALAQDETGAIWAGTGRGAACFDGEQWLTLGSEIVAAIAFTPGEVWLGTTAGLKRLPRTP